MYRHLRFMQVEDDIVAYGQEHNRAKAWERLREQTEEAKKPTIGQMKEFLKIVYRKEDGDR